MADPRQLLDREQEGWERFLDAVVAVDASRRDEPGVTAEGWSATVAVFHVAWWLDECGRVLEEIGRGRWDPATDPADGAEIDAINASHVARARAMAWDDVVEALVVARKHAREAFGALPEATPDAWSWFEESGPIHYEEHLAPLAALRGTGEAAG
jgi:hypothetical protein